MSVSYDIGTARLCRETNKRTITPLPSVKEREDISVKDSISNSEASNDLSLGGEKGNGSWKYFGTSR